MALFGDGITFEPLTGDDLDDIAGLAADAWYSPDGLGDMTSAAMEGTWLDDSERDRVARLMATDEIAAYLQEMTWGVKALLKGRMVGVIVTHGTHTSAETAEHFGHVGAEARKRAEELLTAARERAEHPDNTEPTEPIYLDEIRATKEMRAEADEAVREAEARAHALEEKLEKVKNPATHKVNFLFHEFRGVLERLDGALEELQASDEAAAEKFAKAIADWMRKEGDKLA